MKIQSASSKNNNYIRLLDGYVLFILIGSTLIDSITGFLLRYDLSPVISLSQLFKFPLILVISIRILMGKENINKLILSGLYFLLFLFPFIHMIDNYYYNPSMDWTLNLKVLFLPLSFLYFQELIQEEDNYLQRYLKTILVVNVVVIALNIMLGYVGIGFSQYSGGIGSVGFFYAGNDISTLFILLVSLLLLFSWHRSKTQFLLVAIFTLIISFLSATKVAMLGVVLNIIAIPIIYNLTGQTLFSWKNFRLFLALLIFFILLGVITKPVLERVGLIEMWQYWYQRHNFLLLTLILSGRNKMLALGWNAYIESYNGLCIVFGKGYSGFFDTMEKYSGVGHFIEMDPFDILFIYGFFGLALFSLLFFFIILKQLNRMKEEHQSTFPKFHFWLLMLLLLISFLAGHVFISGISALYLGLFLSLIFDNNLEKVQYKS